MPKILAVEILKQEMNLTYLITELQAYHKTLSQADIKIYHTAITGDSMYT